MGHVRIGFLPHTKQWNAIVTLLGSYENDPGMVANIADRTIDAVRKEYEKLQYDESIVKAIGYLANIIVSSRQSNQLLFLQDKGYQIDGSMSLYALTSCVSRVVRTEEGSLEINKLAKDAAVHAIMEYYEQHSNNQISLFEKESNPFEHKGSGKEFCELARLFFADFTEKQIRYYIDREASSVIGDYKKYELFSDTLTKHSLEIANHAFEISKIMQSFAAGWFNKYALDRTPSEEDICAFLHMSFGKMREELRMEAMNNE